MAEKSQVASEPLKVDDLVEVRHGERRRPAVVETIGLMAGEPAAVAGGFFLCESDEGILWRRMRTWQQEREEAIAWLRRGRWAWIAGALEQGEHERKDGT